MDWTEIIVGAKKCLHKKRGPNLMLCNFWCLLLGSAQTEMCENVSLSNKITVHTIMNEHC